MTTYSDHRHARTIRTQEHTRARKCDFSGQGSTKKTKKYRKNVNFGVGVVEAASSSLVTQTNKTEIRKNLRFALCGGGFWGKVCKRAGVFMPALFGF